MNEKLTTQVIRKFLYDDMNEYLSSTTEFEAKDNWNKCTEKIKILKEFDDTDVEELLLSLIDVVLDLYEDNKYLREILLKVPEVREKVGEYLIGWERDGLLSYDSKEYKEVMKKTSTTDKNRKLDEFIK